MSPPDDVFRQERRKSGVKSTVGRVVLDLDFFKHSNHSHGHRVGYLVLWSVVE